MFVETNKGNYVVYSSLDEYLADGNDLDLIVDIPYATAGTYIETEQGYLVPVISRMRHASKMYLQLPLFHINIDEYWSREKKGKPWYPIVVKENEEITFDSLKPEHKAIVQLVGNGVPLQKASFMVYGRNITLDIFGNELLVRYLGKHIDMNKWKEALEKKNVDETFVVDQLFDMATNNDTKAQQGRIYAIERLSALVNSADKDYGSAEVVTKKEGKGYFKPLSNLELPVYAESETVHPDELVETVTVVDE